MLEDRDNYYTLTVKQPWAWAIIYAGKDVENRTWIPKGDYRGPIIIHAGKAFDYKGYNWMKGNKGILKAELPKPQHFKLGGIIGEVDFRKAVRSMKFSPWMFGPWGWVLENPMPLPFYRMPGKLGLYDVGQGVWDDLKMIQGQWIPIKYKKCPNCKDYTLKKAALCNATKTMIYSYIINCSICEHKSMITKEQPKPKKKGSWRRKR